MNPADKLMLIRHEMYDLVQDENRPNVPDFELGQNNVAWRVISIIEGDN